MREFFLANARYWVEEFHIDGLRLDATQNIYDDSPDHILAALGRARYVRPRAGGRPLSWPRTSRSRPGLVRSAARGGYGLDALWNDDLHHTAVVALTGKREGYYTDYTGSPQEFISAVKYGYSIPGATLQVAAATAWHPCARSAAHGLRDLPREPRPGGEFRCVVERVHRLTSPGRFRALTAFLLLAPGTPMLFQGQEFNSSAPFLYFADHGGDVGRKVREGRAEFLAQFPSIATPEMMALLPDPTDAHTFERCKLDAGERQTHHGVYTLHRDLLWLRRRDVAFSAQTVRGVDGAVLSREAFVLRFFGPDGADRLVAVNLGPDLLLNPAPEPLLAPVSGTVWTMLWSSEDLSYGGAGTPPIETKDNWRIPAHAAIVLHPTLAVDVYDPARGGDRMSEEEETRTAGLARLHHG